VTPVPFGRATVTHGRVAIEGRPVCNGLVECAVTPNANIPVTSATADFAFHPANPQAAMVANPRRQVVDIAKCMGCHDGGPHGDTTVPRLSLHGGNRNQNLDVCVMCHNANQTDVPYRYFAADPRISGPETAVDFKTMVHSIHAGGFRETPFVVIGRGSSINDYSDVRSVDAAQLPQLPRRERRKGELRTALNASVLARRPPPAASTTCRPGRCARST